VVANGWIEGLTVGAIILGTVLGGALISPRISAALAAFDFPGLIDTGIDTVPEMPRSWSIVGVLYLAAALFNLYVPDTGVDHKPLKQQSALPDPRLQPLPAPAVARQAGPDLARR
jgi:LPLT family lysophospholipid transporter-like MFS transporter